MQRIINDPNLVVEDMLKGFLKCHKDRLHADPKNPRTIVSNSFNEKPKVGIVTGGGSGHKPAFIGYCGRNMVDAVAVGEIFSSPTAEAFEQCIRAVDQGLGVAVLYGNYAGDNMNVKMAKRAVEKDGIAVKLVVANDDVPSDPVDRSKRRGVAGEIMMWKCGGAKAAMGGNLDEVIACAQKAIDNTRSVGIGLGPCTIPANGKPNFSIEPGTMEVGIGHHGEPGVRVEPLKSADEMAQEMVDIVLPDLPFVAGDEVVVLVSGLGATPIMEQYIFFSKVYDLIEEKGISIYKSYVGDYFTSLEMNGITLTVMKLDDELKACIDMPVECDGLTQFGSMPIAETVAAAPVAAARAFAAALDEGKSLGEALDALATGAADGLESTRGMQAKIGRAARLGERSIGHLDAGATSCDIILETLAKSLADLL